MLLDSYANRSVEEAQDLSAQQIRKSTMPLTLAWRGALRDLGETQTSVELERQALDWWERGNVKMQMTGHTETLEQPLTLTEIVSAIRTLPALEKLKLIRIIAEELEDDKEIFPFESGKTYCLPTPYDSYGAASALAEAMAAYQEGNN
jgi:hypothetical protein